MRLRWIDGAAPYKSAEERLRFTYRVVKNLEKHDDASVVQAWLVGLNPELDDRVPIRLLREGDLEKVGPEILGLSARSSPEVRSFRSVSSLVG